jgi:alpha(1,3/1,4) fucosyltransferase
MNDIKIWFADFWPEWLDEDFISPILKKHFNIILDKKNPDFVFHSIFNRMSETPNYKCPKILFLGENHRPSRFGSDWSISFDPHSESNFRLPLWQVFLLKKPELKERLFNRKNWGLDEFKRFCSFTVSNPSNFLRNSAYSTISQYKPVTSYGRYMTTDQSLQGISAGKYWRDAKDQFFLSRTHKFSIVFENSPYPYYCTEKLMDAFLCGSMPIYNGDPKIGEDWNKEAFIEYKGSNELEKIKSMDKDPDLFLSMYQQPVFTQAQKEKLENNLSNFEDWLIKILNK